MSTKGMFRRRDYRDLHVEHVFTPATPHPGEAISSFHLLLLGTWRPILVTVLWRQPGRGAKRWGWTTPHVLSLSPSVIPGKHQRGIGTWG